MLLIIVLLLCLTSISNAQINCRTTSWWVLQPISKSILQPFLVKSKEDLTFNSSNPLASFMKTDEHPVYFEFNQQNQCEESSLPPVLANLTEQTFVEFKLQLPYLIRQNRTVMLKPLLYQNSIINVAATHLVYGLPSNFPLIPTMMPFGSPETANFSSFVDANVSPWLAFPPLSLFERTKCASNIYNFSQTALVRPVKMILNVTGDILEEIPYGIYTNPGNQPLGAWQIDVNTTITSTYQCP